MSAALVLRRSLLTKSVGSRGLAGGHGHGHGPAKVLPPRPALAANASFGQRIQHQLWDKRHPGEWGRSRVALLFRGARTQNVVTLSDTDLGALAIVSSLPGSRIAAFDRSVLVCLMLRCADCRADYEGAEAYVRYYLPHNHNVSLQRCACRCVYSSVITRNSNVAPIVVCGRAMAGRELWGVPCWFCIIARVCSSLIAIVC